MRPMPLMPTFIVRSARSRRCVDGIADLVEALLQRHPVERCVGKVDEDLEAPADHAVQLVDHRGALHVRSHELGGIGQRPGACDGPLAEVRALLALQDGAKSRGANAVVDIVSYYKKNEFKSATNYECWAGTFVAGVALKGTYAKVK